MEPQILSRNLNWILNQIGTSTKSVKSNSCYLVCSWFVVLVCVLLMLFCYVFLILFLVLVGIRHLLLYLFLCVACVFIFICVLILCSWIWFVLLEIVRDVLFDRYFVYCSSLCDVVFVLEFISWSWLMMLSVFLLVRFWSL